MVGPVFVGRPARLVRISTRAGHGWDSSGRTGCASSRASGRNNDNDSNNHIDNGNTAAIIASRIAVVAPVQPGQRAEKIRRRHPRIGADIAGLRAGGQSSCMAIPSLPRRIRRFWHVLLPDNGRQPRPRPRAVHRRRQQTGDTRLDRHASRHLPPALAARRRRRAAVWTVARRGALSRPGRRESRDGHPAARGGQHLRRTARTRVVVRGARDGRARRRAARAPDWPLSFVLGLGAFLLTHLLLRDLHALARAPHGWRIVALVGCGSPRRRSTRRSSRTSAS